MGKLSARNCKGKTVEQLGSRAFASRRDDEPDGVCVERQLVCCAVRPLKDRIMD